MVEEHKKVTITIVGILTISETFWEQFSQFSQAMHTHMAEAFPDFRAMRSISPITVRTEDISAEEVEKEALDLDNRMGS